MSGLYKGDLTEDQDLDFKFHSKNPTTGAPATLSGTPVISVYKDNGTTQTTTGPTLTVDFDTVTGLNHVRIATTDAFYVTGSDYTAVITTGTVGGVSVVGTPVAEFSIENRFDEVDVTKWLGTAVATPTVAGVPEVDVTHMVGGTQTVTDLKDFADAGYDPATNKVQGVVLVDTTTDVTNGVLLSSTATSAQLVDDIWDEPLTGGTHNVATSSGRRLRNIQDFGIYDMASVWVDEVNGTSTGTTDGEDATVANRANDFDNAQTVAASVGLDEIHIQSGNTITLTALLNGYRLWGALYDLVLGGQDISNNVIESAGITGTGTIVNGSESRFMSCIFGTASISAEFEARGCFFSDTLTLTSSAGVTADHVSIYDSASGVPGAGSPTIDASGLTKTTTIENRKYGGGCAWSINSFCTLSHEVSLGGTQTLTNAGGSAEIRGSMKAFVLTSSGAAVTNLVCTSGVPITVNGTGGTINIYGMHNGITDNSGAGVTINELGVDITLTDAEAVWDEVLTGATHNIADSAGRRMRNLQEFGSYEGDSVWIDTVAGSPGTTDYESGTILNKVDSIADANTIGASLGLAGRAIIPGSSITLAASQNNQNFWGNNWTLALGGQSVSATHIRGANVSGLCTGANEPEFHECQIGAVTVPPCRFVASDIGGTVTLPVGDVHFHACAGETGGILDYGATVANTTVYWSHFSGEITIDNLGQLGTDILNLAGDGRLTLNASCIGGTINLDGHITVTNNGSGITINEDNVTETGAAILADTNELQADWANGGRLDLLLDQVITDIASHDTSIDSQLAALNALDTAIKAKTDQLTFTKANELDSNIQSINDVTITGDGSATPFDV